jgi:phosphatidylglycerol:prolipoprotein diacylglycerol transferase
VHPILGHLFGFPIASYAVFVVLAFLAAAWLRRRELLRLGTARDPRQRWLGLWALGGAMLGAKLGMLLFEAPDDFAGTLTRIASLDFTGKTVVGGIAGGYLGVEMGKRRLGISVRTGDAWAVAVPLAQGIGRIGCFLNGCCGGQASDLPWAVTIAGIPRHPAQLYEAGLDLLLAAALFTIREQPRPQGHLFRWYLMGYALIRLTMETVRDDAHPSLGPLTPVQAVCVLAMLGFGGQLWRERVA